MKAPETPIIPDHKLIRLVGRGSYGEVWLARNALGTARAVKVVRRDRFDSDRPYFREFSGIQKFEPISRSHDGLVDILQVGRNDTGGFFYYVMELADDANAVEGTSPSGISIDPVTTLDANSEHRSAALSGDQGYRPHTLAHEIKKRARLAPSEALPLFNDLAVAVGHIHGRGLLHRDIKPTNVIFVAGVPKLADIGLVAEPGKSDTFVGTPGFIPPEGPGTISADLYALGKLMYETVTGRDRLDFPALTLDPRDPDKNQALLELNEILLRCCDPSPAKRYQNAAELQADLAVLRSGHSVQQLRAYERGFRVARQFGIAATIAALVGIVATVFSRHQANAARQNAEVAQAFRRRAEDAERAASQRLYTSLAAQARAERRSGLVGARENALTAIRQAAQLKVPTTELRSEAAAAFALVDLTEQSRWKVGPGELLPFCLHPSGEWLASALTNGFIEVTRVSNHSVIQRFQVNGPAPEWLGPYSPNGRWLVYSSHGSIHLLDLKQNQEEAWPLQPDDWRSIRFQPNSSRVALLHNGVQAVCDLESGDYQTWLLPSHSVYYSVSPELTKVTLADASREHVRIWDFTKGIDAAVIQFPLRGGALVTEWSADSKQIAIGTADHHLKVWTLGATNATLRNDFTGHGAEVTVVGWSPDGQLVASSGWDETTRLWNLATGRESALALGSSWPLQFTTDGHHLLRFDGWSRQLILSDVNSSSVCRVVSEQGLDSEKSPNAVMFTPEGKWMITGGMDGLRAYNTSDWQQVAYRESVPILEIVPYPAPAREFAIISPWGRHLGGWTVTRNSGFQFTSVEEATREQLAQHNPTGVPWVGSLLTNLLVYTAQGSIYPLPFSAKVAHNLTSPNGKWVEGTFADHHAGYWNLGAKPRYTDLGPCRGYAVAFSPDSKYVYHATSLDLCKTDVETGQRQWTVSLTDQPNPSGGIEISPDGSIVAAAMSPFRVSLVDNQNGQVLAVLEHPDRQLINGIAFSPDGTYLAVICTTHVTQVWNLKAMRAELAKMNLDW